MVLPGGQPDLRGDLVGASEGDIGDQEAGDAFAFPHRGVGIGPQAVDVGGQGAQPVADGCLEQGGLALGAFVGVLGLGDLAQGAVPVGFQGVGDQAVVGVDGEVAAPGEVGVVLGPFHVAGPELVGLGGAGGELVGDFQGGVDGQRGESAQDEAGDGGVQGLAGQAFADPGAVLDGMGHAPVVGQEFAAVQAVADRHPCGRTSRRSPAPAAA